MAVVNSSASSQKDALKSRQCRRIVKCMSVHVFPISAQLFSLGMLASSWKSSEKIFISIPSTLPGLGLWVGVSFAVVQAKGVHIQ